MEMYECTAFSPRSLTSLCSQMAPESGRKGAYVKVFWWTCRMSSTFCRDRDVFFGRGRSFAFRHTDAVEFRSSEA